MRYLTTFKKVGVTLFGFHGAFLVVLLEPSHNIPEGTYMGYTHLRYVTIIILDTLGWYMYLI